jgi:hypothetical protein
MGRKRIHENDAEASRAYRDRKRVRSDVNHADAESWRQLCELISAEPNITAVDLLCALFKGSHPQASMSAPSPKQAEPVIDKLLIRRI